MTTPTVIATSPDAGFPWVCWPVVTTGTITYTITGGTDRVVTMPATPWVLSPDPATMPDGARSAESIITTDVSPGWSILAGTSRAVRLLASGRLELRAVGLSLGQSLGAVTFSGAALARRFGFSTVGPHSAVGGVVTSTQEPVRGVWWAPHVGSIYGETAEARVASLEGMTPGRPSVSVWGTIRRGLLRSPLLHRARVYSDAMLDARYRTPAGITQSGASLPNTLEDALAVATDLPWRLHLRLAGIDTTGGQTATVYRDVWIADADALRSANAVSDEQDSGRRITVTIPVNPVAP